MKKLLSLVLSFTIIFSSITPALAQVQTSSSANVKRNIYNQAHPFIPGIMSEAMMKAMSRDQVKRELIPVEMQGDETFVESVYTQYLMEYYRAYEQEVKDKAAGVRFCEKNQFGSNLRCVGNFESEIRWVFDGADNEAAFYKAVKNGERYEVPIHMEWPSHGDKTVEKHDLITFAHGVLRWTLNDLMKGKDKIAEEEYVRFIDEVSHIAEVFDSATEDRADLKKFLETILQNGNKQCKGANGVQRLLSGSKFVPIGTVEKKDQAAQKVCEKLSEAVVLYGSMYANGEKGSAAASELIYQTVKDVYDENFGALVLQSGIGSLLMIDTPTSVNKIYELLMKDTVKELKWYAPLKEILNLLSFEEWNKKGIAGVNAVRGGAGNYLNETGLQLQYVDKKTAKAYGLSDFDISNAQAVIPSIQERYNLPYGNMLEDIGVMIASYKGKQTKGLVKRIQDAYLQNKYLKGTGNKLHMPLIVGIYSVLPKASVNKPLYEADWWDLNEGTQRRVNNLVGVPAGFKARTKDEAKMRRSLDNFKVQQLGFWTDILSIAIFGGMLIASLPSIVRSAATLLRHVSKIRAIRVARIRVTGHGKVLSNVRASMKARGITKQSIKTARAKAQAPVKGKPQANANATQTTKSTANAQGKPAQQARVQSRDVGQMPEEVIVEDAQGNAARYNVRTGESVPIEKGAPRTGTLEAESMTTTMGEGGGGASAASGTRAAAEPVIPRPISAVAREESAVVDVEGIQTQVQGLRNGALKGKNVNTVYVERGGKYYDINGVEVPGNYPDRSVVALTDGRLFIKNNGAWKNFGNWKGTGNIGGTRPWNLRMHDWWVNRQVGWQLTLENVKYGMRDMVFHPDHLVMGTSVPFATTARMASPAVAQVEAMQLGRTIGQLTHGASSFGRTAQSVGTLGRTAQGVEHAGQLVHTFGGLNGAMGGVLGFPIITRELIGSGYAVAPSKIFNGLNTSSAAPATVATNKETTAATKETSTKENNRFSWYQKAVEALSSNATPQATKRAAAITIGMATAGMAAATLFGVNGLTTDVTIAGMSLLSGVGPLFSRSKSTSKKNNQAKQTAASSEQTDPAKLGQLIEQGINKARLLLQAREIKNDSEYALLLSIEIRAALEEAGIVLNAPEVIHAVNFALLSELPDSPLLRQQAVDVITGRELSLFKKLGRTLATRLSGKMVDLKEDDLGKIEQAVLKTLVEDNLVIDYQQLRAAIHQDVTLIKSEQDSFIEEDENGHVTEYPYTKETHDFSRLLDKVAPEELRFEERSEHLGFRPHILQTGVKDFPYLYTSILLKTRKKDADGHTTIRKNIYTVVLSDDADIFKKLKPGWSLVTDTYGNLYKTDGKTKKIIYDRKVSVVHLKGLENMPVVVIQKTKDRLKALNLTFSVMGFSSTGRFLNGSLESQYGGILGGNAGAVATGLSTGVYFTNIAPLIGLKTWVQRRGGGTVVKTLMPFSLVAFAWATIANVTGVDPHGWGTLLPVIASIFASGITSAAIQQNANPAAKRMKKGKNADELVAGGQLFKTIGSMGAYVAYAAAAALLGKWQYMYAILAIPTALSLFALWTTDLPLPRAQRVTKNTSDKMQAAKAKGNVSDWQFFKDPAISLLFVGLLIFCGSETQASTATKSIMTGLLNSWEFVKSGVTYAADFLSHTLPWMQDVSPVVISDALSTLITGLFTMGPVFLGRLAAKKLLAKLKGVEKVNQKLMLVSAVATLGFMGGMYTLGPKAGAALIPMVIGVNALLGNMFTLAFNIMKEHDEENYNNAFDALTGSLSTAAVIGCFLIPTLISTIITAPIPAGATAETVAQIKQQLAFDQLIVPMGLILAAVLANHRHFANPFNWKKPLQGAALTKLQTSVVSQMQMFSPQADLSEVTTALAKENPMVSMEEIQSQVTQTLARMKTNLAALLEVSVEEFDNILATGTSKKITEATLDKLCSKLGISSKQFKKDMARDSKLLEHRLYNELMRQVQRDLEQNDNSMDMKDDMQTQPAM